MAESPLIQEQRAGVWEKAVLKVLKTRFGTVPSDVRQLLAEARAEKTLERLHEVAVECDSMDAFKEQLLK